MLRVPNLKLPLDATEEAVYQKALQVLRLTSEQVASFAISKKSVDARDKAHVHLVFAVDVEVHGGEERVLRAAKPGQVQKVERDTPLAVPKKKAALPPVVAGLGPCGLFAALYLARAGLCPVVLERGERVEDRARKVSALMREGALDEESNMLFGEGGAGTFSDGKLTTGIKNPLCRQVLHIFHDHGAPDDILLLQRPHIGTDKLPRVVSSIRQEIEALGGQVLFGAKLTSIHVAGGAITGLTYVQAGQEQQLRCDQLLLATGHSARDTYAMLHQLGVEMVQKPFSIGLRIEHPQPLINKAQYGGAAGHPALPAAEYHLAVKTSGGRGVYTFCMCPGGTVVPSASEKGRLCTNGMSVYLRNGANANSALLADVRPEDFGSDHPLAGIFFQRQWEEAAYLVGGGGYVAPAQLVGDFLQGIPSRGAGSVQPTYRPGVVYGDVSKALPGFTVQAIKEALPLLDRRLHGFALPDAVMTAAETRSSSPVRILRTKDGQANIRGLYPAGEGAGQAGGIMSAAVDGLKMAMLLAESLGEAT